MQSTGLMHTYIMCSNRLEHVYVSINCVTFYGFMDWNLLYGMVAPNDMEHSQISIIFYAILLTY